MRRITGTSGGPAPDNTDAPARRLSGATPPPPPAQDGAVRNLARGGGGGIGAAAEPAPQTGGAASTGERGDVQNWKLRKGGERDNNQKKFGADPAKRKLIIIMGGLVVLVLVLIAIFGPADERGVILTTEDKEALEQYRGYLTEAKKSAASLDITRRFKDAENRLKKYRVAAYVGEKAEAERQFDAMLVMDNDRGSPLFRYCSENLTRSPEK